MDGFSILCDQPRGGSNFDYDPEFNCFREFVEPERDVDVERMNVPGAAEQCLRSGVESAGARLSNAKDLHPAPTRE
jgi:hypothetical protein